MPAFVAHIHIADVVHERLKAIATKEDPLGILARFVTQVLDVYPEYMHLGANGPDLPYYGGGIKSIFQLMETGHNKPIGVDQWSYQLHSREPNLFPMKMAEIIWKESDPTQMPDAEWQEEDEQKFAFLFGFLTHMAADQTIHPLVNSIAGPYTKAADARREHGKCEVYQDIYLLGKDSEDKLTLKELTDYLDKIKINLSPPAQFQYLIQKTFVEAHAVTPTEDEIESWIGGLRLVQFACGEHYKSAYKELFKSDETLDTEGEAYAGYINKDLDGKRYDDYVEEAVKVSCIYTKALLMLHESQVDDIARSNFRKVVRNADLGAPLEVVTEAKVKKYLDAWV
jgi:hypothetical protein